MTRTGPTGIYHGGSESFRALNPHLVGTVMGPEARQQAQKQVQKALGKGVVVCDVMAWMGLPAAIREHRFHSTRRWRFDYAWPAQKVALEVEGGVFTNGRHTRGKGYVGDMEKYNAATVLGWRIIRCTPDKLMSAETVEALRGLLT